MPFLMQSGRFESEALEYTQSSGNRIQRLPAPMADMKKAGEDLTRLSLPAAKGIEGRGLAASQCRTAGAAAPQTLSDQLSPLRTCSASFTVLTPSVSRASCNARVRAWSVSTKPLSWTVPLKVSTLI